MVVVNVLGAEVMVLDFLSLVVVALLVVVASLVVAASLVVVTEPDSTTVMQRRSLEALVGVEVALVVAFELVVGV